MFRVLHTPVTFDGTGLASLEFAEYPLYFGPIVEHGKETGSLPVAGVGGRSRSTRAMVRLATLPMLVSLLIGCAGSEDESQGSEEVPSAEEGQSVEEGQAEGDDGSTEENEAMGESQTVTTTRTRFASARSGTSWTA